MAEAVLAQKAILVTPAKAGRPRPHTKHWIPASAGMTIFATSGGKLKLLKLIVFVLKGFFRPFTHLRRVRQLWMPQHCVRALIDALTQGKWVGYS